MKILAVCGMGFGSSMMLKMTLEKVLKEKGLRADVQTVDFGTVPESQLISSLQMKNLDVN